MKQPCLLQFALSKSFYSHAEGEYLEVVWVYICYLVWKIATAPVLDIQSASPGDSPGLRDGFILNLINPKAYAAFLSLFSQFLLLPLMSLCVTFSLGFAVF